MRSIGRWSIIGSAPEPIRRIVLIAGWTSLSSREARYASRRSREFRR